MNEQNRSMNDLIPHPVPMTNVVAINRKELLNKVPLSDRTIFDMEKRGEFPQRFCLSNRVVAWDLAEVNAWLESRKNTRGNSQDAALSPAMQVAGR
jgi:prophage regulatory protein